VPVNSPRRDTPQTRRALRACRHSPRQSGRNEAPRHPQTDVNTLADSGYLVGLFNPKDHHHKRCKAFLSTYTGQTTTTWAVFIEVCALLAHSRQKSFFAWAGKARALGYLHIESPPADALGTLWNLMDKYDDLPMDFCDASLVYLAITLKIDRIATTDVRDFSVYRLPGNRRFTHVLDQ
jgi:predicted nucleic acid-binding protein